MSVLAVPTGEEQEGAGAPAGLAGAVAGFLVLGAAGGLGADDPATALRVVPSGLWVWIGALTLAGPALLVGHQYLGLGARPADLVAVLGQGFVRAGRLSLGLAPVLAFFSLTTGLWAPMAVLCGLAASGVGLGWIAVGLGAAEPGSARMELLVAAWCALAGLVGLRLAVDAAAFVAG